MNYSKHNQLLSFLILFLMNSQIFAQSSDFPSDIFDFRFIKLGEDMDSLLHFTNVKTTSKYSFLDRFSLPIDRIYQYKEPYFKYYLGEEIIDLFVVLDEDRKIECVHIVIADQDDMIEKIDKRYGKWIAKTSLGTGNDLTKYDSYYWDDEDKNGIKLKIFKHSLVYRYGDEKPSKLYLVITNHRIKPFITNGKY